MLDQIKQFLAGPLPRKILFFDEMLTPSLIRTAYWLGLISLVWTGLGHIFTNGFWGIFEGFIYIAMGVIVLRVIAELVMLLFKLNDNMQEVALNTKVGTKNANTVARKAKSTSPVKTKTAKKVAKKVSKKVTKKVSKKSQDA